MEEQNKASTSSTSTEGGGRGDGDDVKEVVDNNKQQLRNERERERRRLNQDLLALSNDHVSDKQPNEWNLIFLKLSPLW